MAMTIMMTTATALAVRMCPHPGGVQAPVHAAKQVLTRGQEPAEQRHQGTESDLARAPGVGLGVGLSLGLGRRMHTDMGMDMDTVTIMRTYVALRSCLEARSQRKTSRSRRLRQLQW